MTTEKVTVGKLRRFVESGNSELREIERRISDLQMDAFKLRQRVDNAIFMILDSDDGSRFVSLTKQG